MTRAILTIKQTPFGIFLERRAAEPLKISVSTCFTRQLTVLMRGHSFDSRAQTQTHPGAPGFEAWGFSARLASAGALQCSCRHHVAGGGIAPRIAGRVCFPRSLPHAFPPSLLPPPSPFSFLLSYTVMNTVNTDTKMHSRRDSSCFQVL